MALELEIHWDGPYSVDTVRRLTDGGTAPEYGGQDYGLYQIYGTHILGDKNALVYIGQATQQTFGERFCQHETWLLDEENVQVYVGRPAVGRHHSASDAWHSWEEDVRIAERAMIYKYSPHYNSMCVSERPDIGGQETVVLVHVGIRGRIHARDVLPNDW